MVSLLSSKTSSNTLDQAARRNRLRRSVLEMLERRELMASDFIKAAFAPGTTAEYRNQWYGKLDDISVGSSNSSGGQTEQFNASPFRWTNPTGGASPNLGDPAVVTWSIVPDGTLNVNDNRTSNLISFMDSIYGGGTGPVANRPWFNLFQRAYDQWSAQTGLTFVYEAADDGASFAGNTNRGVVGVRGDIRIGGNAIDGNFGVLGYNFLPTGGGNAGFDGDMVIDTGDRFFRDNANSPTGENRGLINFLMHEIGHGIGLRHVIPINGTKLMEPNVSLAYLGAQHDDLLGAQLLYGDNNERNGTLAAATNLGELGNGTVVQTEVSINGRTGDLDWYKFRIAGAGRITLSVTPVGEQYLVGPDGGTAVNVDTRQNSNLALELVGADGSTLAAVNANGAGAGETITNLQLPSGGEYFIRVSGDGTDPQLYQMSLTLAGIVSATTEVTGPRLLSVSPNSGEIFSFNAVTTLNAAPTELVLRFDGSSDLDGTTLAQGIRVMRAGKDGRFDGVNDQIITPGFIGFGDNTRIVILRFKETLPDDLYRVEVMGAAVAAENLVAIRSTTGNPLTPRLAGTDRDVFQFRLQLGAQIIAVVPQPVDRNVDGTLAPQLDTIRVYFNDDDLDPVRATDPNFYQLIYTADSVQPNDDVRFIPTTVVYDAVADMATLTFSAPIDQLAGAGTYRLRIGSNTQVNSVTNPPAVPVVMPGADPSGFFSTAISLDAQLSTGSVRIVENLANVGNPLPLDFIGSDLDPGNRDINNTQITNEDNHVGNGADSSPGIARATYSFTLTDSYGLDSSGRPVFTSITPDQMQRVREVFEFFSAQLGIDFTEIEGPGATYRVVVGDLWPNGRVSRPGGEAGVASGGLAIMDGAETWDNSFGGSFFGVTLHEVGHMLGLGHSYDLPPGTTMGDYGNVASEGSATNTQQFPGNNDVIHGQFLYRPDNKDVDLYQFTVGPGQFKSFRAETIAERLSDSSNANTVLTLYKQTPKGLVVVARNDDYFSSDSFLKMDLEGGASGTTYFIGVTVSGNQDYSPEVGGSGSGGTSEGRYELFVELVDKNNVSLTDVDGVALDGDGDGLAGGDFNFWFRTAAPVGVATPGAPKMIFVDKGYTGVSTGSPSQPFKSLPAAAAATSFGDILRVVGSVGTDGNLSTVQDNPAYELGRGGPGNAILSDGLSFQVPRGVTMMVEAGAIFKLRGSRIVAGSLSAGSDASFGAIQVLGTPTQAVFFTSYDDQSLGIDTNPIVTTPQAGNWAGIQLHNDVDRSQGRGDWERRGIFLNYLAHADIRYGGGQVTVVTPSPAINPIFMAESRPTLLYNRVTNSSDAAFSADPDSFEETRFTEPRYQLPRYVGDSGFRPDYGRVGPDMRGNILLDNSVNGIFVRVPTVPGQEITSLNVAARFDDTDIVHVFGENLLIGGTPGGAITEIRAPDVSLLQGVPTTGGTLAVGNHNYKITFVDRFGNEGIPSAGVNLEVTAGNSALTINNLPAATGDFVGRRVWRLSPGDATYQLVVELDRSGTTFVDRGQRAGVDGGLLNATTLQRARTDARLAIDPGIIIKSLGSRIEAGVSAQLIAEGTASRPIIFTSKLDDRYGAGGTFDTNNDRAATFQGAGDWGGLVARHLANMSIDNALIAFGGGVTAVPGGFAGFNAVEFHQAQGRLANSVIEFNASGVGGNLANRRGGRGSNLAAAIFVDASQPIIVDNIIRTNAAAAIAIDIDSMKAVTKQDSGRQTGEVGLRAGSLGNMGPLVRGNRLAGNAINGMEIRGGTLTTETVWDDTDIVHVLRSDINIPNHHHIGGLRLVSRVDESLVVKLEGANAGFTADGRLLDINDRIGGTVQIQGAPGFPVVLTSLRDDSVGAGFDPTGLPQFDTNGNGSGNAPAAGNWRSIRITPLANDRNVASMPELESDQIQDEGTNDDPVTAQALGALARSLSGGDENLRLGFVVNGAVASPADVDVYSFVGTAGTQVWIDLDRTGASLDSVVELITENGVILSQSDNSLFESAAVAAGLTSTLYQNPDTALIAANLTQVMEQDPFAIGNSWTPGAARDLHSINPLDAGMRVVLPGTQGTTNTYYVRVRSNNLEVGDPRSKLQDPAFLRAGKTTGAYQLQVRLQQTDEVAGSAITYADVRYATNGVEAMATPRHSPLLGDNATQFTGTAPLFLGDLGRSDRGALSVAGQLNSRTDVAWFEFSVFRNDVQLIPPAGASLPTAATHVSTVFDIDYADGYGGPNTNLWVYNRADGRLVYVGTDSNVLDDRAGRLRGSDVGDMTRGSAGSRDPFIGAQALPVGNYLVAVTNNSLLSVAMAQYQQRSGTASGANAVLTRMEPIESVRRVVEDRFEAAPPLNPSTAMGPMQVAFESSQAGIRNQNQVPFTLGDIVSYVIVDNGTTATRLRNANVMSGALEEEVSDTSGAQLRDVAMQPDGRLSGYHIPRNTGVNTVTDASSGSYVFLNTIGAGGGQTAGGNSGLQTFTVQQTSTAAPPAFALQQRSQQPSATQNNPVGDGIQFNGLTIWSNNATTNASLVGIAVGSRGNGQTQFFQPIVDGNGAVVGTQQQINYNATNVVYAIDPNTGAALNATGTTSRTGNARTNGAGTNQVEMGRFLSGTEGNRYTDGTVTGLAKIGNTLYAVSNLGELFQANVGAGNDRFAASAGFDLTVNTATETYFGRRSFAILTDNGVPINFQGLAAGPTNLRDADGNSLANVLFAISNNGTIYAFNTDGSPANIFPGGVNKTSSAAAPLGTTFGLAFSTLDVNLWHLTTTRAGEAGHGYPVTFNRSRPVPEVNPLDRTSLYFGFENAGTGSSQQDGIWSNRHAGYNNSVNLPGGAKGAIESRAIDLSGYSADDLPMLYFNYYLQTENRNASNPFDNNFMRDSFRVYATVDGANWVLLATNNSQNGSRTAPDDFIGGGGILDEYDQGTSNYIDAFGNRMVVQELYDVGDPGTGQDQGGTAPDAWRQARINLSPFAGRQSLRLRFEFATGGTFNTGNPLTGGVEITAVPAWELNDSQTISLASFDIAPAQNRTFEFDFGLMLNMPGGASIVPGSTINTPFGTFTLDTVAGPGVISYQLSDSPATVANNVLAFLQANAGVTGYIHATRPSVVVLPTSATVVPGAYTTTGLDANDVIIGRPGVAGANVPIPVRADQADYSVSAVSVRNAMRQAFAGALSNGETAAWSVYGNTIRMFKYQVPQNTSPVGVTSQQRYGDRFGVNNTAGNTGVGLGVAERAQNNAGAGVFIDDIIIGFAERGEQVFNAPLGGQTQGGQGFFDNRDYEPRGYEVDENEEGRFQLEIRTGYDYGISVEHDSPAVPPPANYRLFESFDTNFRLGSSLALQVPAAAAIADGTTFTLNDGQSVLVTFEFNVVNGPGDTQAAGTTPGNIVINLTSNMTARQVALAVRNAINSQSLIDVTASTAGEMIRGTIDVAPSNSSLIFLNGPAAITRTGLGLPPGSPLTLLRLAPDFAAFEDTGDRNRGRVEQGQLIISSTSFSHSSQWGVRLDDSASPTSPRNLPTPNPSRLAVGAVLVNNIFNSNLAGGVTVIGDTTLAAQPVVNAPIVRVINNSFQGTRTNNDAGVRAINGATPTIINNIFSNLTTAISVDAASGSVVVGANVYRNNANNGVLGSFPISLAPSDPLYVNPTAGNFYLAAGSQAIDSSLEALAERLGMSQIRNALGLPPSPMLAPDRDIFGQRRVDDPSVSTPAGLGANVFKDRGATDRSDFTALEAVLLQPQDNDSANVDIDRTFSYVRVSSGLLDYFSILLSDGDGIGPDARTVTPEAIRLTENGRVLTAGVDYVFGYNVNSRTVRLTPLAGIWRSDSVYELTLNNRDGRAVRVASGSTIADGDTVTVTLPNNSTRVLTFRKSAANGPLDVSISNSDSAYQVSLKLNEKINALGGGVSSYVQGSGLVMVVGANAVASSRPAAATVTTIGAIRDLAGNALAANRANTLTQFTIVMPSVQVDYGDTNASPTLQAINGARHALLPVDTPLLALGQFADGDPDGRPTSAAIGDDNDASVDLETLGSVGGVVQGPSGPATLIVPAAAAIVEGESFTITDPMLKSVTFEFTTDAIFTLGAVPVLILPGDTAPQVAAKLVTAVNSAVLDGSVAGIAAVASGATVSLGGSSGHKFVLPAGSSLTRLMVGNVELAMPAAVTPALDGTTFRIFDGAGNAVRFAIRDTANPPAVLAGMVAVDVALTNATPTDLANAIAQAVNQERAAGRLVLGVTSVVGNSVNIRGNDEDGVIFGSLFNSRAVPVPVTIVSTGTGLIDAWIDWNGDGDYIDAGEQILTSRIVGPGANVFQVPTPAGAKIGFTTARFRLSITGNLLPNQLAVGGEVEDYLIEIVDGTPPVAVNDSYTIAEDNVLIVSAAQGLLANDTDADNSPLTVFDPDPSTPNVEPAVAPINGTLLLNTDGSFTYTPNLDFFGVDTFVYFVTDPRLISNAAATVTITVTPVNDAPLAYDDTITILEDAVTVRPGSLFWANDWRHFRNNPNENDQTLTLVNAQIISPIGGSVSVQNDTLTYTPPAHYNNAIAGPALLLLTIRDGGVAGGDANPLESTSTLTINITPVNDRPEFSMPTMHSTIEDAGLVTQPAFITGIRPGPVEATDEATGPALQFEDQQVSFDVRALDPSLFTVQPAIDPTGQLTYELNPDVNRIVVDPVTGVPGFPLILVEVIARDTGAATDPDINISLPVTFTILPTEVNDVPEFTLPQETTSREDVGLVTLPGFVTGIRPGPVTALDETNQTLSVQIDADPTAFTQLPQLDLTTGTITYETAPHINSFTGQNLVVTVTIFDSGSNVLPNLNATTKSFTINVTPVNDAPEFIIPATTTTSEDAGDVTVPAFITNIQPGPTAAVDEGPVRENQTISFEVTALNPELFVTLPAIDPTGQLTYRLADHVNEQSPFPAILVRVVAIDTGLSGPGLPPDINQSEPVTFTILPAAINDAPEFTIPDTITVREDAGVVVVPGFMTDYRPGPVGALDEATQTLTVTLVGSAASFLTLPTIDITNGALTFQTAPHINSFTGQDLVVLVTLTDSGSNVAPNINSTTKSFTLQVTPVNDAPEFTMPATTATSEDAGDVTVPAFITNIQPGPAAGTDEGPALENQTISFEVTALNPELFATLPAIDPTGQLTYRLADHVNEQSPFPAILVRVVAIDTGLSGPGLPPDINESEPVTFTILPTAINDAPEFTIPDTLTVLEDAGLVTVPAFMTNYRPGPVGALDEATQTLTVTLVGSNASFVVLPSIDIATGTLTFETAPDVNNLTGNDLIVAVTLTDSGSDVAPNVNSTTKTFTLSVTPVNDVPRFTLPNSSTTVFEDNEEVIGAGLTQIDGFATGIAAGPSTAVDETTIPATRQTLQFITVSVSNPNLFEAGAGQPHITPAGVLQFDTATDQNGVAVVVVRLVDSGVGTAPDINTSADQTFTINVTAVNDAPEFTLPATVTGLEDAGLRIVPGFATNLRPGPVTAFDEVGQTFTVTVTALDPAAFAVQPTISASGTLTYRTAQDVNSDSPGRDLRVTVTLTDDGTPGPFPDTNVSVTRTFTVLTTPVNDAPLFNLSAAEVTVIEDVEQFQGTTITSFPGFATNIAPGPATATDEATQSLAFNIIDYSSPELFSIAPSISPTGELTFRTAAHRNGKSVVVVRLVDGGPFDAPNVNASDRQTFTISITPVNDPPQFDIPAGLTVEEDQGLVSRTGFATNVRRGPVGTDDENGQTVSFVVTAVNPAAFEIQPTIEVDGTLTFRTANNVNSANADLTVRVVLRDSGPNAPAPNNNTSIEKTFSITVTPVNDPPIPNGFVTNGTEDTQLVIQSVDVLVGDQPGPTPDEAGQTLTITQVERTSALGGTVTPVFTGGVITSIIYTPAANAVGVDTFLYVVSDNGVPSRSGTGTITVVLAGVNDPPSFTKGPDQSVLEDAGTVTIANWATNILAGAPSSLDELSTQTVSFQVTVGNPALFEVQPTISSNGTLSFRPARDAVGSTSITVVAIDDGPDTLPNINRSQPATFTITLIPVNDAPVFTAGGAVTVNEDSGPYSQSWATSIAPAAGLLTVPPTATDEATQLVDFEVVANNPQLFSAQPQISPTGVLSFTPAPNAFGVALVTVQARDRGPAGPNDQNTSLVQTLTITINAVNDAPSAVPDNYTIDENSVLDVAAPGLLANDVDVDGNVGLAVIAGSFTSRLGALVTINANGSMSYDPRGVEALQRLVTGQSLTDDFAYRIVDPAGAQSNEALVTIVVTGIDDAPIAVADRFTVPVGQSVRLNVLANDTDIDSQIDQRTIVITALPAFGTVIVEAGEVRYTPGVGFRGIDTFAYTVRDMGGNLSNEALVTVAVNNVPRANSDTAATTRNQSVMINVLANDFDLDGAIDTSSVEIATNPTPSGTAVVQPDGRILFTPANDFFGQASFTYFFKDDVGSPSNVATVTVTVGSAWKNPTLDLDVNADGFISPIDALLIINYLNSGRPINLPTAGVSAPPFIDPSGDEVVTAFDALLVINYLNTRVGSGEGEGEANQQHEQLQGLAAPEIVTMVTAEQMIATVGAQVIREIEAQLLSELEACQAWSMDSAIADDLVDTSSTDSQLLGDELGTELAPDVVGKKRASDNPVDDFFGTW